MSMKLLEIVATNCANPVLNINPLLPSVHKSVRIDKISILKLEGIIKLTGRAAIW